jgi:hypothetical protein
MNIVSCRTECVCQLIVGVSTATTHWGSQTATRQRGHTHTPFGLFGILVWPVWTNQLERPPLVRLNRPHSRVFGRFREHEHDNLLSRKQPNYKNDSLVRLGLSARIPCQSELCLSRVHTPRVQQTSVGDSAQGDLADLLGTVGSCSARCVCVSVSLWHYLNQTVYHIISLRIISVSASMYHCIFLESWITFYFLLF